MADLLCMLTTKIVGAVSALLTRPGQGMHELTDRNYDNLATGRLTKHLLN